MRQIEAFAKDKPAFPYLENDIAAILGQSPDMTLEEAYAQALQKAQHLMTALNPPSAAEAAQAPPPQKRPARSVTGAPTAGSNPGSRQPSANRTEAIQRAFAQSGLT